MKRIIFKGFIQSFRSKIGKLDGELEVSFKVYACGGEEQARQLCEFLSQLDVQDRGEMDFAIVKENE